MFTGIIESFGKVEARTRCRGGESFSIESPMAQSLGDGQSVSINGVCHTVESVRGGVFIVTSVPETLHKTTMARLRVGEQVNLERAATVDSALGGHIVQGHIDATGTVVSFQPPDEGGERLLEVELPQRVFELTVDQGSIAIDGVSLTVARRAGSRVAVAIIPFTLQHTTIGSFTPHRCVNVEADVIGKYVMQYLERLHSASGRPDSAAAGRA